MTRAEHLAWAKRRALEYVEVGDYAQAMASMLSDLDKHEELHRSTQMGGTLGLCLAMSGNGGSQEDWRRWVEGFN